MRPLRSVPTQVLTLSLVAAGIALPGAATWAPDVDEVLPALVRVEASIGGTPRIGAGVVVARRGRTAWIVTASHILADTEDVQVELVEAPDRRYSAIVLSRERTATVPPARALAVLRIEGELPLQTRALEMAPSVDLTTETPVRLFGAPRATGTRWAKTEVKLSAREAELVFAGASDDGSSGGPVTREGRVVALHVETLAPFAFARSSEEVDRFLQSAGVPAMSLEAVRARRKAVQRFQLDDRPGARKALERAALGNDPRAAALLAFWILDDADGEDEDEARLALRYAKRAKDSGDVLGEMAWMWAVFAVLEDWYAEELYYEMLLEHAPPPGGAPFRDRPTLDPADHFESEDEEEVASMHLARTTLHNLLQRLELELKGPGATWDIPESMEDPDDLWEHWEKIFVWPSSRIAGYFAVVMAQLWLEDALDSLEDDETDEPFFIAPEELRHLLRQAAQSSYSRAFLVACELAWEYRDDKESWLFVRSLTELCQDGAERGLPEAQKTLGDFAWVSERGGSRYEDAARWYRLAAEAGLPSSMLALGRLYEVAPEGSYPGMAEAYRWYEKANAQDRCLFEDLMLAKLVPKESRAADPRGALLLLIDRLEDCRGARQWFHDLFTPKPPRTSAPDGALSEDAQPLPTQVMTSLRTIHRIDIQSEKVIVEAKISHGRLSDRRRTQTIRYAVSLEADHTDRWVAELLARGERLPSKYESTWSRERSRLWLTRATRLGSAEAKEALQELDSSLAH